MEWPSSIPYYRRNLYVLCVTMFLAAVSWNQVAPFLPRFLEEMGAKDDMLLRWSGIIFALPAISSIIAQPFWAKMGDRFGRKPMIIRAGISLAAIYFGMSLSSTPLQVAVFRLLNGALTGFIPGSVALIGTNTPDDEAPRAVATAQAATAIGSVAGPIIGQVLAEFVGYRYSMRISGTAVLISTLVVWWLVQEPNKPQITQKTSLLQDAVMSFRSPLMASIMLAVMLGGTFGTATYSVLALQLPGMSGNAPKWFEGVVFSMPAVAFTVSAFTWTRFGERWGYISGIQIGLVGVAISSLLLTFVHNIWVFAVIYFMAGIGIAAINPSMGALISTKVQDEFRGRAFGMQFAAGMLGAFLAPIAASNIAAVWGIPYSYTFLGLVFLSGAITFPLVTRKWKEGSVKDPLLIEGKGR